MSANASIVHEAQVVPEVLNGHDQSYGASQALERRSENVSVQFMPALTPQAMLERRNVIVELMGSVLKEGMHYGPAFPGSDKPTLLQPGAEVLCSTFGLTPRPTIVEMVQDWTGEEHGGEPFFSYHYRYGLYRGDQLLGEADAICNSKEKKFRWRWVQEQDIPPGFPKAKCKTQSAVISEFKFSVDKAETGGKYGKPKEYWDKFRAAIERGEAKLVMKKASGNREFEAYEIGSVLYRVPNEEIFDQINTIMQMAQKRALIRVTRMVTGASEFFTQDFPDDDNEPDGHVVESKEKKSAAKQQDLPPTSNPPESQPAHSNAVNTKAMQGVRIKRAQVILELGLIRREGPAFWVGSTTQKNVEFQVWRDEAGRVKCTCGDFCELGPNDTSFRCEHILAVKEYLDQKKVSASNQTDDNVISNQQMQRLEKLAEDKEIDLELVCNSEYKCDVINLTQNQAAEFIAKLEAMDVDNARFNAPIPSNKQNKVQSQEDAMLDKIIPKEMIWQMSKPSKEAFCDVDGTFGKAGEERFRAHLIHHTGKNTRKDLTFRLANPYIALLNELAGIRNTWNILIADNNGNYDQDQHNSALEHLRATTTKWYKEPIAFEKLNLEQAKRYHQFVLAALEDKSN